MTTILVVAAAGAFLYVSGHIAARAGWHELQRASGSGEAAAPVAKKFPARWCLHGGVGICFAGLILVAASLAGATPLVIEAMG